MRLTKSSTRACGTDAHLFEMVNTNAPLCCEVSTVLTPVPTRITACRQTPDA